MSRRVGARALARSAGLCAAEVAVPVALYAVAVGLVALAGGPGAVVGLGRVAGLLGVVVVGLAALVAALAVLVDRLGPVLRYGLGAALALLLARALVAGLTHLFGPVVGRAVDAVLGAAEAVVALLLLLLFAAVALALALGALAVAVGPPYLALDALRDRYAAGPVLAPPVVWVAPPLVAVGAVGVGAATAGATRGAVVLLVAVSGSLALRSRVYVEATASDAAGLRARLSPAAASAVAGLAAVVAAAGAVGLPAPALPSGAVVAGAVVAGATLSLPVHLAYEWVVAPTTAPGEETWADDEGDTVLFRPPDE